MFLTELYLCVKAKYPRKVFTSCDDEVKRGRRREHRIMVHSEKGAD